VSQPARPIRTVALVACCAEKLQHAAPAREFYRSPLFRLSLAYAERVAGEVYVLSAQHGLVALDQVLEPYDLALSEMDAWERAWWAHEVEAQLAEVLGAELDTKLEEAEPMDPIDSEWFLHAPHLRVVLLAGKLYRPGGFVERYLEEPLAGMDIGERLSWLKSQVVEAQPEVA
jgi:hypothetical protein